MSKCLGTFKTNQTMYLPYNCGYWTDFKPDYGRYKDDYDLMRMGTVLKAYQLEEQECFDNEKYTIKLQNKTNIVYFEDIKDLRECTWIDEVKEVKDDE